MRLYLRFLLFLVYLYILCQYYVLVHLARPHFLVWGRSFPGYLSYREMPGNENSYREMPGNENAARKKSSLAGHMYTYVCMWRVGREGKNTYGPRG